MPTPPPTPPYDTDQTGTVDSDFTPGTPGRDRYVGLDGNDNLRGADGDDVTCAFPMTITLSFGCC